MSSDAPALPALLDVMEAAGFHDLHRALASLDRAETALGKSRRHKARPDIAASREAAGEGRWVVCWRFAHQAMCGLTTPFPPDISTCPPLPDDAAPFARAATCSCGADLPTGARFCAACGTPVATH